MPHHQVNNQNETFVCSVVAKTKGVNGAETAASAGATNVGISTEAAIGIGGAGSVVMGGAVIKKQGRGSEMSTDNPRKP